jgi:hypothetical protein
MIAGMACKIRWVFIDCCYVFWNLAWTLLQDELSVKMDS